MIEYTVQKYSNTQKLIWDNFITQSCNATFLFKRDFLEYHNHKFEDFSLLVFYKKKLVALVPANKEGNEVFSHNGITYGGIVLRNNTDFLTVISIVKSILVFLKNESIFKLNLKILPAIYSRVYLEQFEAIFHILKASYYRKDLSLAVSLQSDFSFSKLRQRGIKAGIKHSIEVKESENLEEFWNTLLIPNLQKRHRVLPTHSLQEITLLKSRFPSNIRQFTAYYNKIPVAGTCIFETDTVAHTQYIAGNKEYNILGGLDFLFDFLINNTFKNKDYFSFGTSHNADHTINKGLFFWKQGFGAKPVSHDFVSIETSNYQLLDSVFV